MFFICIYKSTQMATGRGPNGDRGGRGHQMTTGGGRGPNGHRGGPLGGGGGRGGAWHIYIYIHTHTHTHTYFYIYIYIFTHRHFCVYRWHWHVICEAAMRIGACKPERNPVTAGKMHETSIDLWTLVEHSISEEKDLDYSYVEINPYEVDERLPGRSWWCWCMVGRLQTWFRTPLKQANTWKYMKMPLFDIINSNLALKIWNDGINPFKEFQVRASASAWASSCPDLVAPCGAFWWSLQQRQRMRSVEWWDDMGWLVIWVIQ